MSPTRWHSLAAEASPPADAYIDGKFVPCFVELANDTLGPAAPFGGFGQSGFGRGLSPHAFDKFTGLKTTWIKHQH